MYFTTAVGIFAPIVACGAYFPGLSAVISLFLRMCTNNTTTAQPVCVVTDCRDNTCSFYQNALTTMKSIVKIIIYDCHHECEG